MTATTARAALGIDIGGTKVAGGIVAADGTIVATARRASPLSTCTRVLPVPIGRSVSHSPPPHVNH